MTKMQRAVRHFASLSIAISFCWHTAYQKCSFVVAYSACLQNNIIFKKAGVQLWKFILYHRRQFLTLGSTLTKFTSRSKIFTITINQSVCFVYVTIAQILLNISVTFTEYWKKICVRSYEEKSAFIIFILNALHMCRDGTRKPISVDRNSMCIHIEFLTLRTHISTWWLYYYNTIY